MKKKKSYILLSFFLLLYPISTVISFIFSDIEYLLAININITLIDRLIISIVCDNIYDGIFYLVIGTLKVILFTVLPIVSLIKPKKNIFIVEFILIAIDTFCIIGLSNNYLVVLANMLFHALTLFIIGKTIKSFE